MGISIFECECLKCFECERVVLANANVCWSHLNEMFEFHILICIRMAFAFGTKPENIVDFVICIPITYKLKVRFGGRFFDNGFTSAYLLQHGH